MKANLKEIMTGAWSLVKKNGFTLSEALKNAWRNAKLKAAMHARIVRFWYQKVDGSIREAYGTLNDRVAPATTGAGRRANAGVQTYFDTEKSEWRCFKKANLIRVEL